jgi:hypothetical protein
MNDRQSRKRNLNNMRRDEEIGDVKVEESFSIYHPDSNCDVVNETFHAGAESQSNIVGEGCYISTTFKNKRFYGVLIEQSALQDGTVNFFHDQSDSLAINERMLRFRRDLRPEDMAPEGLGRYVHPNQTKEKVIQKFAYVQPNSSQNGYRVLLATYANAQAAAEDNEDKILQIVSACEHGGDWVGKHYYKYEVSS